MPQSRGSKPSVRDEDARQLGRAAALIREEPGRGLKPILRAEGGQKSENGSCRSKMTKRSRVPGSCPELDSNQQPRHQDATLSFCR
jgi:hypothetical protein